MTRDLAELVGPTGHVTGVDFDATVIELATHDAAAHAVANVSFETADIRTFRGGPFDAAYARFLFSHLPDPDDLLALLIAQLGRGAVVVVEDVDFSGCFCEPPLAAHDRFVELYIAAVRAGGGDAFLGRRLPSLLRRHGLCDVTWRVVQPVHSDGPFKDLQTVTMERIAPAVRRHGLASQAEIDNIVGAMTTFASDPDTVVSLPRIVQAWGVTSSA